MLVDANIPSALADANTSGSHVSSRTRTYTGFPWDTCSRTRTHRVFASASKYVCSRTRTDHLFASANIVSCVQMDTSARRVRSRTRTYTAYSCDRCSRTRTHGGLASARKYVCSRTPTHHPFASARAFASHSFKRWPLADANMTGSQVRSRTRAHTAYSWDRCSRTRTHCLFSRTRTGQAVIYVRGRERT